MSITDWIKLVCDVLVACAVVAGAVIAGCSLRTWRHELRGRNEYDLARRILTNVLHVRNSIEVIRNSTIEWLEDRTTLVEEVKSTNHGELTYADQQRRAKFYETETELRVNLIEAEVLWGDMLKEHWKSLYACISELRKNLRAYRRAETSKRAKPLSKEEWKAIKSVIYQDFDNLEEDGFGCEVARAVQSFEKALRPYLKK